jgi:hypothetical protein
MPGDFQVFWSPSSRASLSAMSRKAHGSMRQKLVNAIRQFDEEARSNPMSLGEIYRARGHVTEYLVVRGFLSFDIAVDEARRLVMVRVCRPLSGHGLD